MGPGTSSDVLVIFYVAIGLMLAFVAFGFAMRRKGRLQGRRVGLAFAMFCILPVLLGMGWYLTNVL